MDAIEISGLVLFGVSIIILIWACWARVKECRRTESHKQEDIVLCSGYRSPSSTPLVEPATERYDYFSSIKSKYYQIKPLPSAPVLVEDSPLGSQYSSLDVENLVAIDTDDPDKHENNCSRPMTAGASYPLTNHVPYLTNVEIMEPERNVNGAHLSVAFPHPVNQEIESERNKTDLHAASSNNGQAFVSSQKNGFQNKNSAPSLYDELKLALSLSGNEEFSEFKSYR